MRRTVHSRLVRRSALVAVLLAAPTALVGVGILISSVAGAGKPEDPFIPLAMALSQDGSRLAVTQLIDRHKPGSEITVADARTGRELFKLRSRDRTLSSLVFSPDGRHLALAGGDNVETGVFVGALKVVSTDAGREVFSYANEAGIMHQVAFRADGKRLVIAQGPYAPGPQVLILDARTGQLKETLRSAGVPVFHPDGRVLIPGRGGAVLDAKTGREVYSVRLRRGVGLRQVTFSRDGRRVALLEQTAFAGGGKSRINAPGVAHVCDAATGEVLQVLEGHKEQILCAAFDPAGRRLLTGSTDRSARVWDIRTGKELATYLGHARRVLAVAFTADGTRAVSASADGTVRIWDAKTGRETEK